jgi:hypothetical protein
MARRLLFFDGFALGPGVGGAPKISTKYGAGAIFSIVQGRTASTYAAAIVTLSGIGTRDLGVTPGKVCFLQLAGMYPRGEEGHFQGQMCSVDETLGIQHVYVRGVDTSGHLAAYNGNGTLLATSTAVMIPDRWYVIQLKAFIHDTLGTLELKLDGTTFISLTNVDTRNGLTGNWDRVSIQPLLFGSTSWFVADLNVWEGDAGDPYPSRTLRVLTSHPKSGNGTHVDFVPNTGTDHGALVKEVTADDDTTYVDSQTSGARDSYFYDPFDIGISSVVAVQLNPYLKQTDAGARSAKSFFRLGGADYDHPDTINPIPTGYEYRPQLWELNPATGLAWTEAEVNALTAELGLKVET